jgi:hypothetical protein
MDRRPYFLNVDLDIESASSLRSLEKEFGERVVVLFSGRVNGRHWLRLETAKFTKSLETTVSDLCGLVEGLSPKGRKLWDRARTKEFNIGLETRFSSHHANRFAMRPSTLRRITKLGANVAVTLYREEKAEPARAANAR